MLEGVSCCWQRCLSKCLSGRKHTLDYLYQQAALAATAWQRRAAALAGTTCLQSGDHWLQGGLPPSWSKQNQKLNGCCNYFCSHHVDKFVFQKLFFISVTPMWLCPSFSCIVTLWLFCKGIQSSTIYFFSSLHVFFHTVTVGFVFVLFIKRMEMMKYYMCCKKQWAWSLWSSLIIFIGVMIYFALSPYHM